MTLTYDPTPALQNGWVLKLLLKKCCTCAFIMTQHGKTLALKKDGKNVCLSPPAGSIPLPTASLLTELLLRLLSLPTCTHLYPPTRYDYFLQELYYCFA